MKFDYGKEIENLKAEFDGLRELVMDFIKKQNGDDPEGPDDLKNVHPMNKMHPDPKISGLMRNLCKVTDQKNRTGSITYLGVFTSSGRQSNWIQNERNTDDLLKLIENRSASSVLQCIGNNDRLNLLLAVLKTPMTVAAMVEKCGFNTTGQVYHHLKPLIAADIIGEVEQAERGVYAVKPHRVQGIIMMLAGISDLIDGQYSQGNWTDETDEGNDL